jgi:hypothetical protein
MNFKKWLTTEYSHNQLADIANHGCQGGVSGMIYHHELRDIYAEYAEDIHNILGEYCDATGENYPEYVAKELCNLNGFTGACVWFAAEWVAHEVTQGEYIDDDEVRASDQDDEEYPTDESRSYGPHYASR